MKGGDLNLRNFNGSIYLHYFFIFNLEDIFICIIIYQKEKRFKMDCYTHR